MNSKYYKPFQPSVINFLNEIADKYPSAISLASGRPGDKFLEQLNPERLFQAATRFQQHAYGEARAAGSRLLQYGRSAGMIRELIAQQLRLDEKVASDPERMLVTTGCQEAISLCVAALCPNSDDVLLACNPTYGGAVGAAHANGVCVIPVSNDTSDLGESIERSVAELKKIGRKARALYLIPSFDNPTGRDLNESQRNAILTTCTRHRIVVLEDNAYGMFRYEGRAIQPMAALDTAGVVIYLSTFSKTLAPTLRVGAISLPETLFGDRRRCHALWKNLVERKSYSSINTSQISQAIVGGILLQENGSLERWIQPALSCYRDNRDAMLNQLETVLRPLSGDISWNRPPGGFFLVLEVPFRFCQEELINCANDYGVIVMPMSYFSLDDSQDQRIRLAFSGTNSNQIRAGINLLARFIASRLDLNGSAPPLLAEVSSPP
jgi:(S)-3,5-dihydroxyphenylglycine transaminase